MTAERRIFAASRPEIRTVAETGARQITGYAAVFNTEALIANNFREEIAPGAFDGVIGSDVRGLFNHDPNQILGRSAAGTLRLSQDQTGLRYEIDINPDDPTAMAIAARVARGDVTGSSFLFNVPPGGAGERWTPAARSGELPLRTILTFSRLRDVGPVTFPAYNEATAEARAAAEALGVAEAPAPAELRVGMTPAEGEEAAELVQYRTASTALTQATATMAEAMAVVQSLITDETESPTETPEQEAAEEELETARLRSLLVLCGQICGAVSGVSALAQAMLSDEYDPILYARSAEADGDRARRLRLAQASR